MLSLKIAIRYLVSKKSHGVVNVISAISIAGVAVATAAIIVVLSVFKYSTASPTLPKAISRSSTPT